MLEQIILTEQTENNYVRFQGCLIYNIWIKSDTLKAFRPLFFLSFDALLKGHLINQLLSSSF